MARRLPSTPPVISGFTYVRPLGAGGFADVFLYEQNMPRRQVAVKVLLAGVVTPRVRQMFQDEADLMAQLSAHPAVLTVYQASVASDGRPYLVMELCSPALNNRYRLDPLPVPEALAVGIRIAGAIETAHRSGMLHRDVKPSNILTTAYGHPVLADFGIAASIGATEETDTVGMSIPWSAPEVLGNESNGTVASEVWSIAATVYSLLAGRSPFETPGTDNTSAQLIARIQRARPDPIGRDDVPPHLEQVLRTAMSKRPHDRQHTVLELIRDLQSVEAELGYAPTHADIAVDDWAPAPVLADADDRTRAAQPATARPTRRFRRVGGAADTATSVEGGTDAGTRTEGGRTRLSRQSKWLIAACTVLGIVFVATLCVVLVREFAPAGIPTVVDVSGHRSSGVVEFSWSDPGIAAGDVYQVTVDGGQPSLQRATTFSVDSGGSKVCLTVAVDRSGSVGASSSPSCVDSTGER